MEMDSIVHAALEVICSQGVNGLSLFSLWQALHSAVSAAGLHQCDAVKSALWSNLLAVPGLQYRSSKGVVSDIREMRVKSVEECEGLEFKIVANEQLRNNFIGIYEMKPDQMSAVQRSVLERLAIARSNGVMQNQLSKELGVPANNFFYVMKKLESWGLIVRQSTILRTKEASSESSYVNTNLIHLYRYALPLGSQQRLEVIKDDKNSKQDAEEHAPVYAVSGECDQDDVHVKDFLPAMKAVCDRLEKAEGEVLVVSDIKRELGYREKRGHKAWRNVCGRLKQTGLVEVFEAKVDNKDFDTSNSKKSKSRTPSKPVACLRLRKMFSPNFFEQNVPDHSNDYFEPGQPMTSGNRDEKTEQLVELPIEQQIFDIIDSEGSEGLLMVEVARRLGISNKKLHNRLKTLGPRFGLHQLAQGLKKGTANKLWTPGNFNAQAAQSLPNETDGATDGHGNTAPLVEYPSLCEKSANGITDIDSSALGSEFVGENAKERDAKQELLPSSLKNRESYTLVYPNKSQDLACDMDITAPSAHICLMNVVAPDGDPIQTSSLALSKQLRPQPRRRYLTLTSAQREQRILEKLKADKIILRAELHRWLGSIEKDKQTKMDRKTLVRCLNKLIREGHCKIVMFSIPGVTNCGRHRPVEVILHSSIKSSNWDITDQVQDKVRSFEMQIRGRGLSRLKSEDAVPVLSGIQRIQSSLNSDIQAVKSEAMRANGFVLAKMVRARLLHLYLWDYVNNSSGGTESLQWHRHTYGSQNPHSTCKLFEFDAAVKAISVELFLQVVGSSHKFEDMIHKCKTGRLLSDLAEEEYKCLMDTQGTGRLSWLIDVLRRLKLIRLVANGSTKNVDKVPHTTLTHALELKPYIEEPPAADSSSEGSGPCDLRPYFRHDFVLSTREAVDKYWQTLEYCYAAANPKAALHAFPGSAVHEVFLYRSWTTVRVMTAEQRAELLKRVVKDEPNKKLTLKECKKIAKDLNLSLEQVLRVYHDKRQQRLKGFQRVLDAQDEDPNRVSNKQLSCSKRKISAERRTSKRMRVKHAAESHEDKGVETGEDPKGEEQQATHDPEVSKGARPMVTQIQSKFSWTEEADRKMIILYARQRAIQGARPGTDWSSILDLPAPANTCRRRMAYLRRDVNLRKSLMRLCNLLSQRYAQQLSDRRNTLNDVECDQELDIHEPWDNFDHGKIKMALEEVLMYKQTAKLDTCKGTGSLSEVPQKTMLTTPGESENDGVGQHVMSHRKPRWHRLPRKFINRLKEGVSVTRKVHESVAVSNAVELFKLVFLNTSKATEVANLLAGTLRCYSEHDLFSAFDYLREKNFMVGSDSSQPYVLSQNFMRSLSLSQFPSNTGKRAAKFASWIHEKEQELMEGMIDLPSDLQCGDIIHLFALVSVGELSISPLLPNDGVGEPEDLRSPKRKSNDSEFDCCLVTKKQKYMPLPEPELFCRREKGFPGIRVCLSRETILRADVIEFFKDERSSPLLSCDNEHFYATLGQNISSDPSSIGYIKEAPDFKGIKPTNIGSSESLWETMTNYAKRQLLSYCNNDQHIEISPEFFKTAYIAIQKGSDQGLSMLEISKIIGKQGQVAEQVVHVLETFGLVLEVSSYSSVYIVDALYRPKYFLTLKPTSRQDCEKGPCVGSRTVSDLSTSKEHGHCEGEDDGASVDEVHKVTILNLSEEARQQSDALEACKELEGHAQGQNVEPEGSKEDETFDVPSVTFQPILPWINGDGSINRIVYRGLSRRILGIVVQNPGISEEGIIGQMEVLNPQSCQRLLQLMVLDNHIIIRKMRQTTSFGPPSLLRGLPGAHFENPKFVCRNHYFANTMSTSLL